MSQMDTTLVCRCEGCGLRYPEGIAGIPVTDESYTCDDCGEYVMDAEETSAWDAEHTDGTP